MAIHFIHALWNKTPKNAISFDFAEVKNILQKQQKLDYLRNYCCDEFIMCNKPDSDFNQTQIEPENRVGSRHTSQNLRCTKQSVFVRACTCGGVRGRAPICSPSINISFWTRLFNHVGEEIVDGCPRDPVFHSRCIAQNLYNTWSSHVFDRKLLISRIAFFRTENNRKRRNRFVWEKHGFYLFIYYLFFSF